VPAQQGLGLHEEARPAGPGQDAADRGKQRPVGQLQLGSWNLAAEHRELVAQDEDLQVLGGVAAGEQHEQLDRAAQREVGEFRQHQDDLCGRLVEAPRYRAVAGANWQLTATSEFAHPTGRVPARRVAPAQGLEDRDLTSSV